MWKLVLLLCFSPVLTWCPETCRCDRKVTDDLEIDCPAPSSTKSSKITILVKPNESLKMQCANASQEDWRLLDGLITGPVPFLYISLCPLPPVPIRNITRPMGVTILSTIIFRSFQNLSNQLSPEFLRDMSDLRVVRLYSNGFNNVPSGLLRDLNNLSTLDLRDNFLTQIPNDFLLGAENITTLELGNNLIEEIDAVPLHAMKNLKLLNFWGNRLKRIDSSTLDNLTKLESLDLSSNGLKYLASDVFRELVSLKSLNIAGNNFSTLEENLFKKTPNLEILRLYDNLRNLSLTGSLLSGLQKLKEVHLERNGIQKLPASLFMGSSALLNISLQNNALSEIPSGLFQDQVHLQFLDLSKNSIDIIPDGSFKSLVELTDLFLGYNRLVNITRGLFRGLKKLRTLDLQHNLLTVVDSYALTDLEYLREARLSHNRLSFLNANGLVQGGLQLRDEFGNQSPFHPCLKLEHLHLQNNSVHEMFQDWRILLPNLKTLNLSHNAFTEIDGNDLKFVSSEIRVDLRYNQVKSISWLRQLAVYDEPPPGQKIPLVFLGNNPLDCNCLAYDLGRYVKFDLPSQVYGVVNLNTDGLQCAEPENLRGQGFKDLLLSDFACPLPSNCPHPCQCYFRQFDSALIVNCSAKFLTEAPDSLPELSVANHTELWMEHNLLTTVPNYTTPGYSNVTHLYLSYNNIIEISGAVVNPRLSVLMLDNNNLTSLDETVIRHLNSSLLTLISLHGNPLACDCSNGDLLSWIQPLFRKVVLFNNVTCQTEKGVVRTLSKMSRGELCPPRLIFLTFYSIIALLGILVGAAVALYYRYQQNIKVWLFAHQCCLCLVTEDELDKDKRYDAFVSFSHQDDAFVVQELVPRLEASGLTLCLHYRDWVAGEWIPDQIARSVEASRRTLVVLSPSFLASVWGAMEFRAAHKQALSEGRARVVVLLYGDLPPTEQLDPELQAYISMNTYVKWGDPWFWDKLRYALPHAPLPSQKKIGDRIELMHPGITPATTPTTPPLFSPLIMQLPNNNCTPAVT